MALRPMRLTRKREVKVLLKGGEYVGGRWVEDFAGDRDVMVNIQPFKYHELMQLSESERTQEWYKMYSEEPLYTSQEPSGLNQKVAERVEWDGKVFKIVSTLNYKMGILDHYKALMVREKVSAGYK